MQPRTQCASDVVPAVTGCEGADERRDAVGESHDEEYHRVEEIVDEGGGGQFGRGMLSDHDIVGKPDGNHPELSHEYGDAQDDDFPVI